MQSPDRDRPHVSLQTTQPISFGHGWISGVLSVALGVLGLGAVLCFHFPSYLTFAELRSHYPVPIVRAALHVVLVASFLLGTLSVCLRFNKALGLAGIGLTLVAALLGGSRVPLDGELTNGPFLGLDWFLLNLIGYSVVYIPLERAFSLRPEQPIFRRAWRTDLAYFFVSTLAVQLTTLLTMKPAMVFFDWARNDAIVAWVSGQPFVVQVFAILFLSDLTQYWVHRAFHEVPFLWRFHAIHHSVEDMDWLAGSRLHILDAVTTRATTYVPIYILGFAEPALFAYVVWVVVQATFIHANVFWKFRPIRGLLATPAFHHWHHSAEPEAVNKNFAVHLPLLDWLFGTYFLPDRWPASYGLADGGDVPPGYARQFVFPFRWKTADD
jgi:lathosterol oxidase